MKKAGLIAILCALAAALTAEPRVLSVDDAVELALRNNTSVERGEITLDAAKRARNLSWNNVSPSANVGGNVVLPIDALNDPDVSYKYQYGLSASVSLALTPNLYTSVRAAQINYEQGKITFDEALRSVELSVRQTFYGLLYERENITLQEKNLEIAQTQYNNNRAKYNQGRMSEIDVLSAEVNYKGIIPTVENARVTYQNDLDSFKQLLGLELDEDIELSGSLDDELNLAEITLDGVEIDSPDIRNLELKIAAAKNSLLSSRFSAYGPSFSASWNWRETWTKAKEEETDWTSYLSSSSSSSSKSSSGTGSSSSSSSSSSSATNPVKSSSLTLSVTIPLDGVLPWSARAETIRTAKDSVADYEIQLEDAKKSLQVSVDSALRSIKQSQTAITSKQANVALAQRSYNMTLEAYNRGTKDLLTLQNANNSLLSAQVSLKSEIYNLKKAILNLENTIGVPFGTLGGAQK